MQNLEVRVLLIVKDETSRQRYEDALAPSGAKVFVTSSYFNVGETIGNQTYHGLFLDVLTKMEAIKENKAEVYRLAERFPVAHLKIDPRTEELRCFYVGRAPGGTILDFVNTLCTSKPQKLRTTARKKMHLPVLIYRNADNKRPERAVTEDISPNGCFIISARQRKKGEDVLLRFPDLADTTCVKAKVRNVVKWGEGRQLPGFGVKFDRLSPSQITELNEMS